jgi:hypothetical protein
MNSRWQIADGRGRARALFNVPTPGQPSDLSVGELVSLRRKAGSRIVVVYVLWCAAGLVWLPFLWYPALRELTNGRLTRELGAAVCYSALWIIFAVHARRGVYGKPVLFRDAMLGMRRCPSCSYSLANLDIEADGCTVCPECGAAWRLSALPTDA